jgi:hypothetical protein
MSLQVADLHLSADKLAQLAKALGDASANNTGLQSICNGAAADVCRLTAGYVLDPASITNFGRALALFRAYGLAGPVPKDIESEYDNAMKELQSIAEGKRPNLPKVADPGQSTIAGGWGDEDNRLHGRVNRR